MAEPVAKTSRTVRPVNSHNEWDPLEEVIVGRLEGAVIPPNHASVTFNVPKVVGRIYHFVGGFRYPQFMVRSAQCKWWSDARQVASKDEQTAWAREQRLPKKRGRRAPLCGITQARANCRHGWCPCTWCGRRQPNPP